jgi:hypothetical protein
LLRDGPGAPRQAEPGRPISYGTIRSLVSTLEDDRYMANERQLVADELDRGTLTDALHHAGVNLH